MGMQGSPRRSVASGGGVRHQHNGGFGFWVGGSNDVSRAAELIEGPGVRINDAAARNGNPTIGVIENIMELGRATIDGTLPMQLIGLNSGGIDYVEFTEVSFRLFSAQPTTMRGGIYTRPDLLGTSDTEIISQDQTYDDWRGGRYTKSIVLERLYRQAIGLWWIPSVVSPIPLTFEVSIWGMPRWHPDAYGQQEL